MTRNNPYALSVDLNAEAMSVDVTVKERETEEVIDEASFKAADIHDDLKQLTALYGLS